MHTKKTCLGRTQSKTQIKFIIMVVYEGRGKEIKGINKNREIVGERRWNRAARAMRRNRGETDDEWHENFTRVKTVKRTLDDLRKFWELERIEPKIQCMKMGDSRFRLSTCEVCPETQGRNPTSTTTVKMSESAFINRVGCPYTCLKSPSVERNRVWPTLLGKGRESGETSMSYYSC